MDECRLNITREIFPSTSSPFIHLPLQGLWWDQSIDGRNAALFMQLSVVFNTFHPSRLFSTCFSHRLGRYRLCVQCFCAQSHFSTLAQDVLFSPESKFGMRRFSIQKEASLSCEVKEIYWPPRRHRLEIEEPRSNLSLVFHNSKSKWPFNSHLKRNQRI